MIFIIQIYFSYKIGLFFAFFIITFEAIKVQTRLAPQNDYQNRSFVKDIHVVGNKMARNGQKMAIRWRVGVVSNRR